MLVKRPLAPPVLCELGKSIFTEWGYNGTPEKSQATLPTFHRYSDGFEPACATESPEGRTGDRGFLGPFLPPAV